MCERGCRKPLCCGRTSGLRWAVVGHPIRLEDSRDRGGSKDEFLGLSEIGEIPEPEVRPKLEPHKWLVVR